MQHRSDKHFLLLAFLVFLGASPTLAASLRPPIPPTSPPGAQPITPSQTALSPFQASYGFGGDDHPA
ncbi:hypothetical protein O181_009894 [Austropuccinia psidii MF-1]|uniref:Uncharacterized protein n=1 Tax=Austropuccinia psidii MF-1 TaxID=1389203 RepID=A0A9Q3BRK8_9BASI|nr:hypothetical protein [Austropuccinia psidii MF-1]